jgi:hypothetical protein
MLADHHLPLRCRVIIFSLPALALQVKVEAPAESNGQGRSKHASAGPSGANCGSKQSHENRAAVPSGNSKGSPKRIIQRPAQAQVEGVSIHSGGEEQATPAISVLCDRHLSANGRQMVTSRDEVG